MLRYGSAGVGALPHIEGELLKARAGIDISHVPYRGGGPALIGLLGGEVHIFFSALTQLLPYVREGRLRGLAVTSATRSPLAPDIPTMVESGLISSLPHRSISSLRLRALQCRSGSRSRRGGSRPRQPRVKQAFAKIGAEARPASPEQLLPTWRSNRSSGLVPSRPHGCRLIDGRAEVFDVSVGLEEACKCCRP